MFTILLFCTRCLGCILENNLKLLLSDKLLLYLNLSLNILSPTASEITNYSIKSSLKTVFCSLTGIARTICGPEREWPFSRIGEYGVLSCLWYQSLFLIFDLFTPNIAMKVLLIPRRTLLKKSFSENLVLDQLIFP